MDQPQEVILTDIRIPFWDLVLFLVKLTLASIPAMILVTIFLTLLVVVALAILTALGVGANSLLPAH